MDSLLHTFCAGCNALPRPMPFDELDLQVIQRIEVRPSYRENEVSAVLRGDANRLLPRALDEERPPQSRCRSVLELQLEYLIREEQFQEASRGENGAAASLIVVLLWVYYSAQIFLFGAEFTWVYSHHYGSRRGHPFPVPQSTAAETARA